MNVIEWAASVLGTQVHEQESASLNDDVINPYHLLTIDMFVLRLYRAAPQAQLMSLRSVVKMERYNAPLFTSRWLVARKKEIAPTW